MATEQQPPPELPIRQYASQIIAAAREHPTIVVIGETGSGKTTQISQILLDAGFGQHGQIAITQPRRVAAVTVAKRVAEERGVRLGREVGYAVRFEDCTSPDTQIKYLTDGTLLRECLEDAQLRRYAVVVLDEAHERSLSTDILFGVLKRLVKTRTQPPLKLVITSATLDGEKFSAYFNNCPVFTVPGRCYPVDVVHTTEDHANAYTDAAVDAVLQLHTGQPSGDILVFLTGQAEIERAVGKLNEGIAALPPDACSPLLVLPLYASLPPELQVRVFRPAPPGVRRCIVATNVAETSVTVDGVVYVVDSGMVKLKSYQPATGMDSLDVVPTSRVAATQRAGRAGRTRPGKCYRLYTKAFFDRSMPDVTPPEIQRTSLAGAVLHLKALALDIDVLAFDFLDPPSREALEDALRTLHLLDALDAEGCVTPLGRAMSTLPLDPGLARCLLAAVELQCLPEVMSIAAMLSTEHLFEHGRGPSDHAGPPGSGRTAARGASPLLKELVREGLGDHVLMLRLWDAWAGSGYSRDVLRDLGLDGKGMGFARNIRRQLEGVMAAYLAGKGNGGAKAGDRGGPLSSLLRSVSDNNGGVAEDVSGLTLAQRGDDDAPMRNPHDFASEQLRIAAVTKALTVGFAHKLARRLPRHNGYRTLGTGAVVGGGQLAQLHPACSGLAEDADGLLPEWVVYHELVCTSRPFLRLVCATRFAFVEPLLSKIAKIDVQRLSKSSASEGRGPGSGDHVPDAGEAAPVQAPTAACAKKNTDEAVNAARQRYLARKQGRGR